ncbi:GNAT family N-acetyltransferase [Nonomuraea sp. NBC_00507]|uniref:GNAT family N-acetyltransferase n=1 Tax=Nonomuraea sp. NBC_00507 TaxID=2976002 RepID=UPI003FA5832A
MGCRSRRRPRRGATSRTRPSPLRPRRTSLLSVRKDPLKGVAASCADHTPRPIVNRLHAHTARQLAVRDARGEFAGHFQRMQMEPRLGQAMVGYSLLEAHRGKGLVTRAVNLLVNWAFANTKLHRVIASTDVANMSIPSNRGDGSMPQRPSTGPLTLAASRSSDARM